MRVTGAVLSLEQKQMLASMGVLLLHIQTLETIIRFCVTYVFHNKPSFSIEILKTQEKHIRNKTIGYLLHELRQRVGISDDFERVLNDFLQMRNMFVHNVDEIPG